MGPNNLSACIFSITGGKSTFSVSSILGSCFFIFSSTLTSSFFGSAFFTVFLGSSTLALSFDSSFFAPFFGRVDESIASKSIVAKTFGASMLVTSARCSLALGFSFFSSTFFSVFTSAFSITTGFGFSSSTFGSSTGVGTTTTVSFFFMERSCSSFFFLGSDEPPVFINSTFSAFSFAALSC